METFIVYVIFTCIVQKNKLKKHEKVCDDHDYCYRVFT